MAQEIAQADERQDRDARQQQRLIGGVADAEHGDVGQELQRHGGEDRLHAPDQALQVVEDHEHREGDQELEGLVLAVDEPQQEALEQAPDHHPNADRGEKQARIG